MWIQDPFVMGTIALVASFAILVVTYNLSIRSFPDELETPARAAPESKALAPDDSRTASTGIELHEQMSASAGQVLRMRGATATAH